MKKVKTSDPFKGIMDVKNIMVCLKILSVICIIFGLVFTIIYSAYGYRATYDYYKMDTDEFVLKTNEIEHIANINNSSVSEIIELLNNDDLNPVLYLIIPSVGVVVGFITLTVLGVVALYFTKGVKSNKTLFTVSKLKDLKIMRDLLGIVGVIFILTFSFSYSICYLIIDIAMEGILYLFSISVKNELEEK